MMLAFSGTQSIVWKISPFFSEKITLPITVLLFPEGRSGLVWIWKDVYVSPLLVVKNALCPDPNSSLLQERTGLFFDFIKGPKGESATDTHIA
jgi:hypothetical protein